MDETLRTMISSDCTEQDIVDYQISLNSESLWQNTQTKVNRGKVEARSAARVVGKMDTQRVQKNSVVPSQ